LRQSQGDRAAKCKEAAVKEVRNLVNKGAFSCVKRSQLTTSQLASVINAVVFADEKVRPDGSFDKWKVRACASGNELTDYLVGETHSPTINPATVLIAIGSAAINKFEVASADVEGAFLLPHIPPELQNIFVRFEGPFAQLIVETYPEFAEYLGSDGTLYVRLLKYLYGLPQAGHHFNLLLHQVLTDLGYPRTPLDRCAYFKGEGRSREFIGAHVDDLLIVASKGRIPLILKDLESKFTIVSHRGDHIPYIGLNITRQPDGAYTVDQRGYREEIKSEFHEEISKCPRKPRCPMSTWAIRQPPAADPPVDRLRYISGVMKIMWLARLTDYRLLYAVTHLAQFSQRPTNHHYRALCQLIAYAVDGAPPALRFSSNPNNTGLVAYSDASFASHIDGKSHFSVVMTLGGTIIITRSAKIPMIVISSSEAEQYSMAEASGYIIWCRAMLQNFGAIFEGPTKLYHDNESAIWLTQRDGSFARNKHILVRGNFTREKVDEGIVRPVYLETANMVADMGTKPLGGKQILHLSHRCGIRFI